jgi:alanine dehydrogenase
VGAIVGTPRVVGVPKEIKNQENRVGLTPDSVYAFVQKGHKVLVQNSAGLGSGFSNDDYVKSGATIIETAKEIFEKSNMIVKVKEPQEEELKMLRRDHILYTYLHLAPDPKQTEGLIKSKCAAVAYETITDKNGRLPLLAPMSEVAGRLSIQVGAHHLEKKQGGSGTLLGGVPGTPKGHVLILGGGYSGVNAAQMAIGLGANVTILDRNHDKLKEIDQIFAGKVQTIYSTQAAIEKYIKDADLVVGAVLIPGDKAPKLITRAMLKTMKPGSVLVDIAIDQGGCFETSKITTHDNPTFVEEGIIHYCVANMPGAVARTSTIALNNATLPFGLMLADHGIEAAMMNGHLSMGVNVYQGKITNKAVSHALDMPYVDLKTLF